MFKGVVIGGVWVPPFGLKDFICFVCGEDLYWFVCVINLWMVAGCAEHCTACFTLLEGYCVCLAFCALSWVFIC